MPEEFELTIETDFSAAHNLREYEGECERLHGHNYRVNVSLRGSELGDVGMLMDFRIAKEITGEVVGRLDHEYLNELEPFDSINPTTEHIAREIARGVAERLPEGVAVSSVACWESDRAAVRYFPHGQD
jgi:6-pyruvoyltetrahydropterin/6-carboxytetrahydropterin synthase